MEKLIRVHTFNLTPSLPSSEGLTLTTKFYSNGDPISNTEGVFTNTTIKLNSYGSSASFELTDAITPSILRELANQLERERNSIS